MYRPFCTIHDGTYAHVVVPPIMYTAHAVSPMLYRPCCTAHALPLMMYRPCCTAHDVPPMLYRLCCTTYCTAHAVPPVLYHPCCIAHAVPPMLHRPPGPGGAACQDRGARAARLVHGHHAGKARAVLPVMYCPCCAVSPILSMLYCKCCTAHAVLPVMYITRVVHVHLAGNAHYAVLTHAVLPLMYFP